MAGYLKRKNIFSFLNVTHSIIIRFHIHMGCPPDASFIGFDCVGFIEDGSCGAKVIFPKGGGDLVLEMFIATRRVCL
jgi:hypothetical protein